MQFVFNHFNGNNKSRDTVFHYLLNWLFAATVSSSACKNFPCSEICLNCIHIQKQTVFFSFLFCQAYDSLLHVCVCAYLSLSVVCFCGFFTVFTMWLCVFVRPFQCKTHSVICSEMCVINKWPWLQNMAIFRCFQEKADTGNIIHTASEALRGMSEENNDVDVSFVISLLCLPDYTV